MERLSEEKHCACGWIGFLVYLAIEHIDAAVRSTCAAKLVVAWRRRFRQDQALSGFELEKERKNPPKICYAFNLQLLDFTMILNSMISIKLAIALII